MVWYQKYVFSLWISLFILIAGCAQTNSTDNNNSVRNLPTPSNTESAEKEESVSPSQPDSPSIERMVPYDKNSVWNTPIGPSPSYDPYSEEMIATIGLSNGGRLSSDPTQFSYTLYFIDENTPRWDIPCLVYSCSLVTPEGLTRTKILEDVPIPPDATPSVGSDAQMIIIDKNTFEEYDLWGVRRTKNGWEVSNGSVYNILWDGMPAEYGSRGAMVPYFAGLIRPWEITEGRIEHALAFAYPETAREPKCVFPATGTDGQSPIPYAIPEGARLQLDPTLTEADFDSWGLDSTGKIIARALQEYGMFLIDTSGRPKIYAEDLINNPFATQSWTDPALNLTSETVRPIPYTSLHVLEFPPGYWDPSAESRYHGDCFTFPGIP